MKLAVFGGTGFIGYDFVRRILGTEVEPTVYATSAQNLANLARHEVDVRLVRYDRLGNLSLDPDTDLLVNFAHPFGARDGLSIRRQVHLLGAFLSRQLATTDSKLLHVSSMSVYEPFTSHRSYTEATPPRPPRSDLYAWGKYRIERKLLTTRGHSDRLLIVRPTIVYGPFCRPWTDNLLAAFAAGDVAYRDLRGRIQPLLVQDLSTFLQHRLRDFRPGVFNLPGPEAMTWARFLELFQGVVGRGKLVKTQQTRAETDRSLLRVARDLVAQLARDPEVKGVASRLLQRLPETLEGLVRAHFAAPDYRGFERDAAPEVDSPYLSPFYAQDRLVTGTLVADTFPEWESTLPGENTGLIADYFRYRFTDALYE